MDFKTGEVIDIRNLPPYGFVAYVSHRVRGLKPGQTLEVLLLEDQLEGLKRWSEETANILEILDEGRVRIKRGKGFHGVCLSQKVEFYLWGIKLHSEEFFLKLTGKYPKFFINFVSINEGLRAIREIKRDKIRARIVPSPKEVEGYCGFAMGFYSEEKCFKTFRELLNRGIKVETIFKHDGENFLILKGAWEI